MSSIVLLDESAEVISKLPDREAGALIKAVINGEAGKLPPKADLVFPIIMGQVERMRALSAKNTANGMKGGRPKKNPNETQTKATENPNETQTKAPYQYQYQNQNDIYKGRKPKVQKALGFSLERQDVDYNEIARRLREEREGAE